MKDKEEKVCPNCGFCPTCKRPLQTAAPWPTYPWYWFGPYYPYPQQPWVPFITGTDIHTDIHTDTTTGTSSLGLTSGTVSLSTGNDYGPTS